MHPPIHRRHPTAAESALDLVRTESTANQTWSRLQITGTSRFIYTNAGKCLTMPTDGVLSVVDVPATSQVHRQVVRKELEVEVLLSSPPVAPSPTDTAVYRRIAATLSPSAPVVPSFIAGITDSRYFRARGIAAYGFSPFALDWDALHTVHGPDEHIPVAAFDRGVETLRAVVLALVNDTSPARLENRR